MLAAVYGEFLYFLVPAGIINWQEENSHKIQKAFFFISIILVCCVEYITALSEVRVYVPACLTCPACLCV